MDVDEAQDWSLVVPGCAIGHGELPSSQGLTRAPMRSAASGLARQGSSTLAPRQLWLRCLSSIIYSQTSKHLACSMHCGEHIRV